jgi:hypothetical protein
MSYQEQFTGRYDLDGKKIYCKTIDCGILPNASLKYVPHNKNNIHKVISITGNANISTSSTNIIYVTLPYVRVGGASNTNANFSIAIGFQNNNINIETGVSSYSTYNSTAVAFVYYTCTDR